jgi:alkylhydroperoxidase family enzyme
MLASLPPTQEARAPPCRAARTGCRGIGRCLRERAQFSEEELANLSLAIVAINGANRLNIVFRTVPGPYRAKVRAAS